MKLRKYSLSWRVTDNDEINERLTDSREALAYNYDGDIYISNAINEIADSNTPIYCWELYRATPDLAEWVEQGIEEGLIFIDTKHFQLTQLLAQGYYIMIETDLRERLEECLFNRVIKLVNAKTPRVITEIPDELGEKISELITKYATDDGTFEEKAAAFSRL